MEHRIKLLRKREVRAIIQYQDDFPASRLKVLTSRKELTTTEHQLRNELPEHADLLIGWHTELIKAELRLARSLIESGTEFMAMDRVKIRDARFRFLSEIERLRAEKGLLTRMTEKNGP